MTTPGTVDYVALYFKYRSPTPIQGTPTYKALKRLKAELRANASSVESDLGGGNHGYLGLVLSDAEYTSVSPTPFLAPAYPAPLNIPANATQVRAFELRNQHDDAKRKYYECKNVEKALQRFIQDAIEDKYLQHLVNEDTQLIQADIPDILDHLMENYGRVSSDEVKAKEDEIRKMSFHPADPMVLIFGPIETLEKLAVAAGITYTTNQLNELALTVIRNTRDFEQALLSWEALPLNQKRWENLKEHFQREQKKLKAIRGPTMQQAGYHHVNMLAQSLKEDINNKHDDMLTLLQTVITQPTTTHEVSSEISAPSHNVANATTNDAVQLQIVQLLQQLQQDMKTCINTNNNPTVPNNPGNNNNNNTRPRRNRKTPDNHNYGRRVTTQYCWTHGGCNHVSKDCRTKAAGHCDDATFENRMGGSNAYCPS